jgi:hypothetical protein
MQDFQISFSFISSGYGRGAQALPRLARIPNPYVLGTNWFLFERKNFSLVNFL